MKFINKYTSPCFNNRKKGAKITHVILHYTAMNSDIEAISHLSELKNKVSTHFLINKKGQIIKMVDEKKRAWHAGLSFWKGIRDINSYSIGIELDNSGQNEYPNLQIKSLINLIKYLKRKYKIKDSEILAHSDISPYRKKDPGNKFPWKKLSKSLIISLPKKISKNFFLSIEDDLRKKNLINNKARALFMLSKIGYDISEAKKNKKNFLLLIKSYEMRYRPKDVKGYLDQETYELIIRHFNQTLTI